MVVYTTQHFTPPPGSYSIHGLYIVCVCQCVLPERGTKESKDREGWLLSHIENEITWNNWKSWVVFNKSFSLMSFLQKLWMCFNLTLFSGVINPLHPTSNAVSLGLMEVISVNIHEYLCVLYSLFFAMLLSWPAVNSQMSTVFFFMSLITMSGFSRVTASTGSIVPPVAAK